MNKKKILTAMMAAALLLGLLGWLTVFLTRRSIKKRRAKKAQKTQDGQNK